MIHEHDWMIKLPRFHGKRIRADASRATEAAERFYAKYRRFSQKLPARIAKCFGFTTKSQRTAISLSLDDLQQQEGVPDETTLWWSMYRLAANKSRLRKGESAPENPDFVPQDWAIVHCDNAWEVKTRDPQKKVAINWLVLSGRLAGRSFRQQVSYRRIRFAHHLCTSSPSYCSFGVPRQLNGMRLALSLGWSDERWRIGEYRITRPLLTRNARLARSRSRKHAPCPHYVEHDCFQCKVGFNECERSMNLADTDLLSQPNARLTVI
jgi:hypothetical protein